MSFKILFISEPLGTSETRDGTLIANEAKLRGHQVSDIRPNEITFRDGVLYGAEHILEEFDVIHFRPNPPVDMAYLTNLYLLNTIKHKTLIINNPEAIIKFPEKIFPPEFYEFMPPTLITSSKSELAEFCAKHGEIVIKPLYEFGGSGVARYNQYNISEFKFDDSNIPITAQKFIPEVKNGDKRIILIDGEVVSSFLRIPKEGEFLANTIHGSRVAKSELTARETQVCAALRPHLINNGIIFCGIDMIGDYLTEINITSPAGMFFTNQLYGTHPEKKLWDIIESKLK